MTGKRPWEEPFRVLLGQFVSHWGGNISDEHSSAYTGSEAPESTVYPVYSGEKNDVPFTVTISDSPLSRPDFFELAGDFKYLCLHLSWPMPYNLEIYRRDLFVRLTGMGRPKIHYQTNDPEFDQKYQIAIRSNADKRILQKRGYRQLVNGLEPLSILVLAPSGIHWGLEIETESQFDFQRLSGCTGKLVEMAKRNTITHSKL